MTLKVRMLPSLTTFFLVLVVVAAVPGPTPRRDNPPQRPLPRPAPPPPRPPTPHRRIRAVNPVDDTFDIKQPVGTQTPPLGIAGVRPIPLNPGPDGKRPIRSPQRNYDRPRPPFGPNGGPPGPGHVYPQPPVRPPPPRPPVRPEPGRPNNGYRPLPPPQRPPPGRPQPPRPPVRPNPGRPFN